MSGGPADAASTEGQAKPAAQLEQELHEFLALLAHELRNPLGALRNGLSVMQLAAGDAQALGRARKIMERQVAHMVRLIDDSLDVSRIQLNKLQLQRAHVALLDIVSSAVEMARQAIDAAEHELEIALPAEALLLDVDPTRLAQVLGNLLTNAAKFTPRRGRIVLRAELGEDALVVSVEDNGVGLREDSLRSVFRMYSQAEHGAERRSAGLGIGLALVRGLTEMHGGLVHAESAGPGQGSRFVVSLPRSVLAEAPHAGRRSAQLPRAQSKRRVLVVDDSPDSLESAATLLRLSGYEVHVARDGLEAVARAQAIQPEVVLMDLAMPELDGYEATRRIRQEDWGRGILIIALSGMGRESDRRRSHEAGCDEHLVKPVPIEQLNESIEELCNRPSGSRLRSLVAPAACAEERATGSDSGSSSGSDSS